MYKVFYSVPVIIISSQQKDAILDFRAWCAHSIARLSRCVILLLTNFFFRLTFYLIFMCVYIFMLSALLLHRNATAPTYIYIKKKLIR